MSRIFIALYLLICGVLLFAMIVPADVEREFVPSMRRLVQHRVLVAGHERRPVEPLFLQVAEEFSLQPELLYAIAGHESGYHPWALNIKGRSIYPQTREEALAIVNENRRTSFDVGLMQVNSYWINKFDLSVEEALEPEGNLRLGAWILRYCLDRYGYNWRAVGAYHTGSPDNLPQRSRSYAEKIMNKYNSLHEASDSAKK